jgi:hypothetical protein
VWLHAFQHVMLKSHCLHGRLRTMCRVTHAQHVPPHASRRRELLLKSVNVGVLAALFNFGAVARPDNLGIQVHHSVDTPIISKGARVVPRLCMFMASHRVLCKCNRSLCGSFLG